MSIVESIHNHERDVRLNLTILVVQILLTFFRICLFCLNLKKSWLLLLLTIFFKIDIQ